MDDNQRPGFRFRVRLRWTLGSIMVVVAASALIFTLIRPFATPMPKSPEVIGIDFALAKTRLPNGQILSGFAPRIVTSRKATARSTTARP